MARMSAAAEAPAAPADRYLGRFAGGEQGNLEQRAEQRTSILETTDENVRRERLTTEEIDDYLAYSGWNLWDLLAARQTEGENSLIPRQEYECTGFLQCWLQYPRFLEALTDELGADGLVELCGTARREPATKLNHVHAWALVQMALIGRGMAVALGLERPDEKLHELNTVIQFGRRMMHGVLGPGPSFVSARGYRAPLLGDEWIDRFAADCTPLEDPEVAAAFRPFSAQSELFGFLMHFDARSALCDTGPYVLDDGRIVIVRDHFLTAPDYHWAQVADGLPHCVTQAMFFGPADDLTLTVNDLSTTFSDPKNYLQYLTGVAIYVRDLPDTPAADLRPLPAGEQAELTRAIVPRTMKLYSLISTMTRRDRIMSGVQNYTAEPVLWWARAAGLWDKFRNEMEFDELHPLVSQAYYDFARGAAFELLPPVFTEGKAFPPVGSRPTW
jgi:hypothetical protein